MCYGHHMLGNWKLSQLKGKLNFFMKVKSTLLFSKYILVFVKVAK